MNIAHVRKESGDNWLIHSLNEHLEGTAKYAEEFGSVFGLGKIAKIAALVHDYGKGSVAFQKKIAGQSGYDPEAHINPNVDHSTAGAQFLLNKYGFMGRVLGYAIAGHHGGIPNGLDETNSCLENRLKKTVEDYKQHIPDIKLPELEVKDFIPAKHHESQQPQIPLLIRMIYSCLVDADFLDTEAFMTPAQAEQRNATRDSLQTLQAKLDVYIKGFKCDSSINKRRADILKWCRDAAKNETGLFSLTVPTGGGKTLSSMAFALDHAIYNNLKRVIYVIPYTSIIAQNAEVFRDIFGETNVLEHHYNLEPEKETPLNRLSAQNWDSPIVVTTNVRFFESFYSNKSSSCRKLHNIADSVIIFDEAQMFPPEYLRPSLAIIRELVRSYGCSAILCTATQPTLSDTSLMGMESLQNVHEIIPEPKRLYNDFKRVQIRIIDKKHNHDDIALKMAELKQVLTIVNTRKEARKIMETLSELIPNENSCFHLSTMMCPEHRKYTIQTIRKRIEDKLACRVVSTQLIEAGVDIDFPVVYRAVAGLDSIAQAAGRCNRNGLLDYGEVFVFKGETEPPVGHLRMAAQSGERMLRRYENDPLSLHAVKEYFADFYWKQKNGHNLDKKEIMDMIRSKPEHLPFKDIAEKFHFIEEITRPVIVPYGRCGNKLIDDLRIWREKLKYMQLNERFIPRDMEKRAQRFTVQLRMKPFDELIKAGTIEDIFEDGQYMVLVKNDLYKNSVGLVTDTP